MSELMGGGNCQKIKGEGWAGIACGVKGELSHAAYEEMQKFARFLKSKSEDKREKPMEEKP